MASLLTYKRIIVFVFLLQSLLFTLSVEAQSEQQSTSEKHDQDPTKIVTKLGVGYTNSTTVSASIGLDSMRMINARYTPETGEWRLGGSWLLDIGIVNFSFTRSDYDEGGYKEDYSIGTYIPLAPYDVKPWGWHTFIRGGYSYKTGERLQDPLRYQSVDTDPIINNFDSHSIYLGGFAFKPLNQQWSLLAFVGGSLGSEGYYSYWIGTGVSYQLSPAHSLNAYVYHLGDDYSRDEQIGFSYKYEFSVL